MKPLLLFAACILASTVGLTSCKKEFSCERCSVDAAAINQPPIANAGRDQVTVMPKDSVLLDGSASVDPDGTITKYYWTMVEGPDLCSINDPVAIGTQVSGLHRGVYLFELKVTDNKGISTRDRVQVKVISGTGVSHPSRDLVFLAENAEVR